MCQCQQSQAKLPQMSWRLWCQQFALSPVDLLSYPQLTAHFNIDTIQFTTWLLEACHLHTKSFFQSSGTKFLSAFFGGTLCKPSITNGRLKWTEIPVVTMVTLGGSSESGAIRSLGSPWKSRLEMYWDQGWPLSNMFERVESSKFSLIACVVHTQTSSSRHTSGATNLLPL